MKKKRPVNLALTTIKFPLPAITSIFHRISGVVIFIFTPFALWMLQQSLQSPAAFYDLQGSLSSPLMKFLLWSALTALSYHLFAGIRHILMDMHIGESLKGAQLSAQLLIVLLAVSAIVIGVWLW